MNNHLISWNSPAVGAPTAGQKKKGQKTTIPHLNRKSKMQIKPMWDDGHEGWAPPPTCPGDEVGPHRQQPQQYYKSTKTCLHIITPVPKKQHFSSFWALKLKIAASSFSFPGTLEAHELLWARSQEKQGYCPDISTELTGKTGQWLRGLRNRNLFRKIKIHSLRPPTGVGFFPLLYKFMLCPTARQQWPSCDM